MSSEARTEAVPQGSPVEGIVGRRLARQGYYELSAAQRRRLDRGLRFTPAVMLLAAVVGLATRQPAVHLVLSAVGLLALALPAHHPLDLVWNHLLRRAFGDPALPPNPLPRRLAMAAAAGLNLAICLAFTAGRDGLAWGLGALLVGTQLALVARQLCAVSWLLDRIVRAHHRPRRLLSGAEAQRLVGGGALLVDVRSPAEFADGHLPGALNVPIDEFADQVDELLAERRAMVLYCAAGVRCNKAARMLERAGSRRVHQLGTLARWYEAV